ncbi:hypothetical protein LT493_34010 [Streptomyces tricolor]|nr:hypothetical protein [Streptomyces tricolor]
MLDFNAAVSVDSTLTPTLGSPRYLAPEATGLKRPSREQLADLDLFALGISAYEALTGGYPWEGRQSPPRGGQPLDPRRLPGLADLDPEFTAVLLRAIAPRRHQRYRDAEEFRSALAAVQEVRIVPRLPAAPRPTAKSGKSTGSNPFVSHLQTLYSQSPRTNAGTRGLDPADHPLYVETALDARLRPGRPQGLHRLVVITGNAGRRQDRLPGAPRRRGAPPGRPVRRTPRQRRRLHPGRPLVPHQPRRQPGRGATPTTTLSWTPSSPNTRGRTPTHGPTTRPGSSPSTRAASSTSPPGTRTATRCSPPSSGRGCPPAVRRMASPSSTSTRAMSSPTPRARARSCTGWSPLSPTNGIGKPAPPARWRLAATPSTTPGPSPTPLRAPRSPNVSPPSTAWCTCAAGSTSPCATCAPPSPTPLTSGRDCGQIQALYAGDDPESRQDILDSLYFTSWTGTHTGVTASGEPRPAERDRLLGQLRELDVASVPDPQLDRRLDYTGPAAGHTLVSFDQRGDLDEQLLTAQFRALPRTHLADRAHIWAHRAYLAAARRRLLLREPRRHPVDEPAALPGGRPLPASPGHRTAEPGGAGPPHRSGQPW